MRQHAKFVVRRQRGAWFEIAGSYRPRAFDQHQQWIGKAPGKEKSQCDGGEQGQQQCQCQCQRVYPLQPGFAQLQFLIVAIGRLNHFGVAGDIGRYRLRQQQHVGHQAAGRERLEGAQGHSALGVAIDPGQPVPLSRFSDLGCGRQRWCQVVDDVRAAGDHLSVAVEQRCRLHPGLRVQRIQAYRI